MRVYKSIVVSVIVGMFLTGCTPVRTIYRTEYKTQEVLVPVAMEVPEVKCEFKGDDVDEIINKMVMCITKQKKALDILREKYEETHKGRK